MRTTIIRKLTLARSAMLLLGLTSLSLAARSLAQDVDVNPKNVTLGKAEYCPYLDHAYPDRVYFGDTHLHTSYSTDAGMIGCTLGPDEATDLQGAERSPRARASARAYSARWISWLCPTTPRISALLQ